DANPHDQEYSRYPILAAVPTASRRGDLMTRREFILALGVAAAASYVAWPRASRAQQTERMRRIGILMPYPKGDPELTMRLQAFRQELAKLGWTEGVNVQLDERWTADDMD